MQNDLSFPKRLRRLPLVWLDDGQPMYFITACTADRKPWLDNATIHGRWQTFLAGSMERYGWWVACYVLMPDHAHWFARPKVGAVTLGAWVKALKAFVAQREFRWQAGFFDHALRSDESFAEKWAYIRMNPVRKGLVTTAEDWPYWGGFHPEDGRPLQNEGNSGRGHPAYSA